MRFSLRNTLINFAVTIAIGIALTYAITTIFSLSAPYVALVGSAIGFLLFEILKIRWPTWTDE